MAFSGSCPSFYISSIPPLLSYSFTERFSDSCCTFLYTCRAKKAKSFCFSFPSSHICREMSAATLLKTKLLNLETTQKIFVDLLCVYETIQISTLEGSHSPTCVCCMSSRKIVFQFSCWLLSEAYYQ